MIFAVVTIVIKTTQEPDSSQKRIWSKPLNFGGLWWGRKRRSNSCFSDQHAADGRRLDSCERFVPGLAVCVIQRGSSV